MKKIQPWTRVGTFVIIVLCSIFAQAADKGVMVGRSSNQQTDGHRWALIVGINEYANTPHLRYARQDAELLSETLVNYCGFPKDNVILMTDSVDGRSPQFPTRGNLRARINQISQVANKGDILLLSFSGHGINIDGRGYLLPIDGSSDDIGSCVPLSWIRTTLETSAASRRLLILDACHSGARSGSSVDSPAEILLSPLDGAAFLTFASCDSMQLSHEDDSLGHGVFTYSLVQGLKGAADSRVEGNRDRIVTASELFAYASLLVNRWGLHKGRTQTPVLKGEFKGRVELADLSSAKPSHQVTRKATPIRKPASNGRNFALSLPGGIKLPMVWIAGGSFRMGTDSGDEDARPAHPVSVPGFWISKTEITLSQWDAMMGSNFSSTRDPNLPVDKISWFDAKRFCSKLNDVPSKQHFSLPSEAEWEWTCRSGSDQRFFFTGGLKALGDYAWFKGNSHGRLHVVGSRQPTPAGVHDMLGNVWEWCEDWYDAYPEATNPNRFMGKSLRVLRGGEYRSNSMLLSSTGRSGATPETTDSGIGFRVVCK